MKLALLGDIHANDLALEAVLKAAAAYHVDALIVTGDLVGYYFAPAAVLEMLSPWNKYVVRGNHEDMLRRGRSDPDFLADVRRRYGSGIEIALVQLSPDQVEALCTLPHPLALELGGRKILLCHGSPEDLDRYVYPDSDLGGMAGGALDAFDLVVSGHTHYPMERVLGDNTRLVNPGSVGQPRNRQPGAHWALYDTQSGSVSFQCESYDFSPIQVHARSLHPELPYLADVLERR